MKWSATIVNKMIQKHLTLSLRSLSLVQILGPEKRKQPVKIERERRVDRDNKPDVERMSESRKSHYMNNCTKYNE